MDCPVWCAICVVLLAAAGVLGCRLLVTRKSLDNLIDQLGRVGEGGRRHVEVYSRNSRVVAIAQRVNDVLEREQAVLDEKNGDLSRLNEELAFFSHDIRTPVAVTQGYMELLEVDGDGDNRRGYLNRVREKLATMREMIDELCDYSVIAVGDEALACESVVVYDLVSSVLVDYYEAIAARGWEPQVDFDDESYRAICPEGDLRRVLSNLVGNVLKYGAGAPHITLRGDVLHVSNKVADPSVIDTARMFDRFWRGDPARSSGGNGLGLAVARALCERMGIGIEASVCQDELDIAVTFMATNRAASSAGGQA